MSTVAASPQPADPPAPSARATRLGTAIGVHTVTDFFSFLFIPIMSVLEGRLSLSPYEGAWILAAGSICSGFVQPLVAWLGDRLDTRLLCPVSLAMAVISMSLVGHARTFEHLMLIQIVGTLGIGGFHPAAVASVGQLSGRRRSLGVSLFFCAGMAGGVLGNNLSPLLAKHIGLPNYVWLMAPGLLAALLVAWAIRRVPHRQHDAHAQRSGWTRDESRERWFAVGVLYVGNVMRFTVNMMMVQLVIRWTERVAMTRAGAAELTETVRESASTINGPMQGAMQIGMAVGGLSAGALLRKHHEKGALILVPLVGAVAIGAFPWVGPAAEAVGWPRLASSLAFLLAVATGLGYAGVVPVTIALAQRLLPHRTALASGLMMGGAWGFAAIGPVLAQRLTDAFGLENAFLITGATLCVAGVLSCGLSSRLLDRVSPH